MSDLKRSCPACDSWTSSIGAAVRDGEPCPYCGLPAEVFALIDAAEERGVSQAVTDRLAKAEQRLAEAEAENRRLQGILDTIRAGVSQSMGDNMGDSDST